MLASFEGELEGQDDLLALVQAGGHSPFQWSAGERVSSTYHPQVLGSRLLEVNHRRTMSPAFWAVKLSIASVASILWRVHVVTRFLSASCPPGVRGVPDSPGRR